MHAALEIAGCQPSLFALETGLAQRVPGDAHAERGAGDALRVEPAEHLLEPARPPRRRAPEAGSRTSSKCSVNCFSGSFASTGSGVATSPGRPSARASAISSARAVLVLRPVVRDDEQRLRLVDAGDVVLGAVDQQVVAVARAPWWRAGACSSPASGSVIAKTTFVRAVGQARAATGALRRRCRSRRSPRPRWPRTPAAAAADSAGSDLLAHDRQLDEPAPPPPCSSGRFTPTNPASPSAAHSSLHGSPARRAR